MAQVGEHDFGDLVGDFELWYLIIYSWNGAFSCYGCSQLPGGGERCSMAVLHVTICSEFFKDAKLTQESLELRYETWKLCEKLVDQKAKPLDMKSVKSWRAVTWLSGNTPEFSTSILRGQWTKLEGEMFHLQNPSSTNMHSRQHVHKYKHIWSCIYYIYTYTYTYRYLHNLHVYTHTMYTHIVCMNIHIYIYISKSISI